jgi:hypothetical protein
VFKSRLVNRAQDPALNSPISTGRASWNTALRFVTLAAVVFTLGNAGWAAWDQGLTYDEPFHLGWPQRLLEDSNDSREQFRFDSKTPALLPAVVFRKFLERAGVESDQVLRFSTRLPQVALLGLVLLLVFRLARTDEPATAWIGLLLAALDANLGAHASIATTDLAYTFIVLLFAAILARGQSWFRTAVLIGIVLGAGLAVKYTVLLLVPIALFVLLRRGASGRERLAACALTALVTCLTACTLYLWVGVMTPLGSIPLQSGPLKTLAAAAPSLRLPLPRAVLTGIDLSIDHNRPELWASYVFGADHRGGVWYYFLAQWLMKTPVALVLLLLAGLWGARRRWRDSPNLVLSGLLLLHLGYFSFFFATQIGLRFALPSVALSCALAARGLGRLNPGWLVAAAILAGAERVPYWGDPLAFTNLAVWPKSEAYWYTADSNLDWGQNRERVARYARESGKALILDQATITPGLFVVAANDLAISDRRRSYRFLVEHRVPASNVGFTHFAFEVTGERFDEYMNSDRMAAAPGVPDQACAPPLDHYAPGARIPFEQTESPGRGRLFLVCVTSRKGADLGFTVTDGRLWFGRMTANGECDADLLQEGQQAWFRVPRASEARLCLKELPYRRTELAYRASGYLTIRGQGADAAVRRFVDESGRPGDDPGPAK